MANDTYDLEFTPEQLARIEEAFQALEQAAQNPTLSRYQRRKMALALLRHRPSMRIWRPRRPVPRSCRFRSGGRWGSEESVGGLIGNWTAL